jgi:hypothetical protein
MTLSKNKWYARRNFTRKTSWYTTARRRLVKYVFVKAVAY